MRELHPFVLCNEPIGDEEELVGLVVVQVDCVAVGLPVQAEAAVAHLFVDALRVGHADKELHWFGSHSKKERQYTNGSL